MVDDETLFRDDGGRRRDGRARDGARRERRRDRRARQGGARRGQHRAALPRAHAAARRPRARRRTARSSSRASPAAPLYVVHVSCREAVEPIALARETGWNVWGETCTQYFFVDYTFLEKPNFEGAKYVYTPPPRPKANQDVLWNAVRTDVLSVISTDHCAFLWDGQKTMGRDDFSKIPNGGPGLENRLHMIHEFGARRADLAQPDGRAARDEPGEAVRPLPAQGHDRGRLRRRHRRLRPERSKVTISAATQHSKSDYNLFEGTEVTGTPEVVLLRGNVLVENDELVASPGVGQFVARAKFGEELQRRGGECPPDAIGSAHASLPDRQAVLGRREPDALRRTALEGDHRGRGSRRSPGSTATSSSTRRATC